MSHRDEINAATLQRLNFEKAWDHYVALGEIVGADESVSHEDFRTALIEYLSSPPEPIEIRGPFGG